MCEYRRFGKPVTLASPVAVVFEVAFVRSTDPPLRGIGLCETVVASRASLKNSFVARHLLTVAAP